MFDLCASEAPFKSFNSYDPANRGSFPRRRKPSSNVGRYTFMGDLNPFAGFRAPATDC